MTAETSQTLDRGLRVLKLLADTDHGLTVTELSHRLGVNRTVVYRLLATLEAGRDQGAQLHRHRLRGPPKAGRRPRSQGPAE
ncbi:helix-turn-helix domain-containing protein, partial [Streptomyces fradiae]|uniref:helix-turn-helix domain-containing protein n=1 Tax=Streptomyces fradiae TaxID=1906 RepID=UPI0034320D84